MPSWFDVQPRVLDEIFAFGFHSGLLKRLTLLGVLEKPWAI